MPYPLEGKHIETDQTVLLFLSFILRRFLSSVNKYFMLRLEPVSPPCPATADWPATPPRTVSHRPCPPGQHGEVIDDDDDDDEDDDEYDDDDDDDDVSSQHGEVRVVFCLIFSH